jgi:hypothetical protein
MKKFAFALIIIFILTSSCQPGLASSIVAWGDNSYGQATPPAGSNFIAVAAGFSHSLALKSDGSIVGWGDNSSGQATPPDGNDFIAIAAGWFHSLALKSDGSIVGWGHNYFGQATPPDGNDFIAVAAGQVHSLALKSDGSIVGWGRNFEGQATPPAGNDFIAIAAGWCHSLALKSDGSIVAWGNNGNGQATSPSGNDFIAVAAGEVHSLALKSNGSIVAWGDNKYGQAMPPFGSNFIAVAAGWSHSLALKSDGSVVGWGHNYFGQATPPDGNNFVAITAGGYHNLALVNTKPVADAGLDQTVYAWIDGIAEVNLDGSASYDDDNQPLTYLWSWTIDGNTYDTNGVDPTIELPVGVHTIELVVSDGWEDSEPNQVVITVIEPIEGTLLVAPQVINQRCEQLRIMSMLRLPAGITKDQIDSSQKLLLYPGEIEAVQQYILPYCANGPKCVSIFAFFDKDELLDAVDQAGQVQLDVVGQLKTGQYFYGSDTVRIINLPRQPPDWPRGWFNYRHRHHSCVTRK